MEKNIPTYLLIIDEELSSELQVDYVAMVDQPAIERNFLQFKKEFAEDSYNDYPEQAKENAKIALRWAEQNGWSECGTEVGKIRANQLAKGENISRDTIARMSAFERHRQNSQKELGDGCGRLMWLCWGGDAGIEWAQRKLKQIDKEKFSSKLCFEVNEDKQEIFGPAMLADVAIYRNDKELGQYNVVFDKATIYKIAQKFFEKDFNKNFNLMHDPNQKCTGVYAFQSYIVDSAEGRPAPKGYEDAKDGSWFLGVKVNNADVWSKIKSGEIKGFSVEGVFEYKKKELTSEQLYREIEQLMKELDS